MIPDAPNATKPHSMTMHFSSADEIQMTALALHKRAEELRSLAKKNREMGKQREAINIEREAGHIGEFLLPQVRTQLAAPFDDSESLIDALERTVGRTVRNATVRAIKREVAKKHNETEDDFNARCKALADDFEIVVGGISASAAAAVLPFLEAAADMAYNAGLEERNATPANLAKRAVQREAEKQAE